MRAFGAMYSLPGVDATFQRRTNRTDQDGLLSIRHLTLLDNSIVTLHGDK